MKESQNELWNEVYRDFQDIFDYRQSSKQRDKWFEDVKKEYFVCRNDQLSPLPASNSGEVSEDYWKKRCEEQTDFLSRLVGSMALEAVERFDLNDEAKELLKSQEPR